MMLTGFILAAGFGTRLKPLTDHIQKALLPVCGRPLLQRSLEFYSLSGIRRIGVNAFHFPDQMRAFQEQSTIAFELFQETEKIRGTGGAFHFARNFLSESDYFFTCNVDIIAQVNFEALHRKFLSSQCSAGLVAIPLAIGGSIYYDRETKEYGGAKNDPGASGARAEFLGMAFYKKDFLKIVRPDDFSILPVWKRAQEEGQSVKIIETEAIYWKDAGTPASLAGIHFDMLGRRCSLSISPDMIVDFVNKKAFPGNYSPDEISRLGSNVWCEAAHVPANVYIENSIVFDNAVLAPGTSLKNTLVTQWGKIPF
jgi:NDP-sugar pyrophosphorylase family protein